MLWANPKETTGFLRMLCDLGTHGKPSSKTSLPQNPKILASNPWMVTRPWHKVAMLLGANIVTSLVPQPQLWQAACHLSSCCIRKSNPATSKKRLWFPRPCHVQKYDHANCLSKCIEHTMICQGARPSEVGKKAC